MIFFCFLMAKVSGQVRHAVPAAPPPKFLPSQFFDHSRLPISVPLPSNVYPTSFIKSSKAHTSYVPLSPPTSSVSGKLTLQKTAETSKLFRPWQTEDDLCSESEKGTEDLSKHEI